MTQTPSTLNKTVHAQLQTLLETDPTTDQLNLALRLLAKWRAKLIGNTHLLHAGNVVPHGPFAGMVYGVAASEGANLPRLLGAYEASLSPIIQRIIASQPQLIIDVGCAEGYYAVGLARCLPQTQIWAHDTDQSAQDMCRNLAEMNGVLEQIKIGGTIGHADFDICKQTRSVVICDTEGAEKELLDPTRAQGLQSADILVECHPHADPDMENIIHARFAQTHDITSVGRMIDQTALPDWLFNGNDLDRLLALWEWRSTATPWLWMTARNNAQDC